MNLKKGEQVKILSGKDKGKTGEILEINRKLEKIKVKSINMIKRHTKPTKENKGGIISKESFIHQSNVKNIDVKKTEKKAALPAIVRAEAPINLLNCLDCSNTIFSYLY